MSDYVDYEYLTCSAELCDVTLHLQGDDLDQALSRIARNLLESPNGGYLRSKVGRMTADGLEAGQRDVQPSRISAEITCNGVEFGCFQVAGRAGGYGEEERLRLVTLAHLTGKLMRSRAEMQRCALAFDQIEAQLQQQIQILDQIHESVITMDLIGFIISWNKGAERLFGYAAEEAIGRNILFLYDDEDTQIHDPFIEHGGREMEVRRRKKSGEIFWASLTLSPLRDGDGRSIGLIGYFNDITERKQAEERIHHLAYYDDLTGLPNRSLLMKLVDQALAVAQRYHMHGSLLFIDLNRFKPINDTLGHAAGDRILQEVALRFRNALRDEDIVARLGSDEFVVVLFDVDQHYHVGLVAQKLLALMEYPFSIDGNELRLGASIGVSVYPQDGGDTETLLRLADIAMYRAKRESNESGRGGYAFYSQDMNQSMLDRLRIETGLRRAVNNGQLLLHYQPKVNLASARIIGAEALVRWRHPELGLMQPGEFIPLAEETGLVVQIGEWVLEAACIQAQAWKHAGLPPVRIAVNVSAREFTDGLPQRVREALQRHGLAAEWLELEITESTLMKKIEQVITIMDEINALGVTLSLDDFGTGYSSLSYLKRFPIDSLKIDRSFTIGLPDDLNDCAIASTIISISQQLGHKVIAEGVETVAQLEFLRNLGCDEIQGYLFSQPVPAEEFERMMREGKRLGV